MKKKGGITLIALIVTIILLLIIAGVTISLVLGENGLLNRAKNAGISYEQQAAREKLELALANLTIDKMNEEAYNENQYINDRLIQQGMKVNDDIVTVDGWQFEIDRSVPKIAKVIGEQEKTEETVKVLLEYELKQENRNVSKEIPVVLKDSASKGIDANLQNAEYNADKTGIVFDGESTYSQLDSNKLQLTYPLTITIAAKWEKTNNQIIFIDTASKIGIGTYGGQILLSANDNSKYYNLPSDFTTNEINYITVIYHTKATDNELYINGNKIEKASNSSAWTRSEANSYLGRRASGSYFKGILYEFKIYDGVFTEEEIIQNYEKTKGWLEQSKVSEDGKEELLGLRYTVKENNNNISKEVPYILKDKSNYKNDIEVKDADYDADKTGIIFNGNSTYGQYSNLEITFPVTVSIVAKWEKDTSQNSNIIFSDINSKIGIGSWQQDEMIVQIKGTAVYYYTLPSDFYTRAINYITIVYKSIDEYNVYINGIKLEGLKSGNGWNLSEGGIYLGRRASGSYFKGTLYKFKIYEEALSEEKLKQEYEKDKQIYEK